MKRLFVFLLLTCIALPSLKAQRYKDARSYYREFQSQSRRLNVKNMRYLEAVAQGSDERMVAKYREMVLDQLKETKRDLGRVGAYKEDDVLWKEYMKAIDMYIEAYSTDFGKAQELSAEKYTSYENLKAYYEASSVAEIKLLDANFKIEKAEDFFAKTYKVDLRRDTAAINKAARLDDITVYTRDLALIYYRVDAHLLAIFKAVDENNTDTLSKVITDLRKDIRVAQSEIEEVGDYKGDDDLVDFILGFIEGIDESIDEELRPTAEVLEARYQDQESLADAKDAMADYKAWHDDMALDFFEVRKEMILAELEEEY
tara:strand:- start:13219 stop:14163 length:945 start_codon:yes stop_codon:yes gene_type:complete